MKQLYRVAAGVVLTGLLVGCIDDKYNISDADMLSRIEIKDLAVPLKINTIVLDSIVDLTDNENIDEITYEDGSKIYAFVKNGDVESDPIDINPVDVLKPHIDKDEVTLVSVNLNSAKKKVPGAMTFKIKQTETSDFTYTAHKVDKAIVSLKDVRLVDPMKISLELSLPDNIKSTSIENVVLQFPTGLTDDKGNSAKANIGTYDMKTGQIIIDKYDFADPQREVVEIEASGFLFEMEGVPSDLTIDSDRTMTYNGHMGVLEGGTLSLEPKFGSLENEIVIDAHYDMDGFSVRDFSGELDYTVKSTEIDPIHLDDLPDFLKDKETKIMIADPQFYIDVTNPTAQYGTKGKGVLSMTSEFANIPAYSSESSLFTIQDRLHTILCISPSGDVEAKNVAPHYQDMIDELEQTPYPGMKYLLSGDPNPDVKADGLPTEIRVAFKDPVFFGNAVDFPVRYNTDVEPINAMKGHYEFFAPLSFEKGSVIVYKDKVEIDTDEMDNIFVQKLSIKAMGTSDFPVDVKLYVEVYDGQGTMVGKSLPVSDNNPGFMLPANSTNEVSLIVEPLEGFETMNHIDHLEFVAYINQDSDNPEALSPSQGVTLNDLKIRISGYYQKKF